MFDLSQKNGDPKDWARRILNRHEAGEQVRQISLRFACEALKLPVPQPRLRQGRPA
jgi:hypothetical protein